jgi:RsmE family RNA methyltransferase
LPEVRIIKELKPFLEDELAAIFPNPGARLLADPSGEQNIFQCLENTNMAFSSRILLSVGPEGGWTPYELELFTAHGFQVFNAGPRILRTDTACIALLSMVSEIQRREI